MRLLTVLGVLGWFTVSAQIDLHFEDNRTPEYDEVIQMYRELDKEFDEAQLIEYGKSDVGRPIYLFVMNKAGIFNPTMIDRNKKTVVLVNNGIHPGESCGVDASLLLADEVLRNELLTEDVIYAIIPLYNVGGSLNRSCCTRANQNGPAEQGFRGNARNLDLNRDFIKCDSRNAKVFTGIYREWRPHIFIDTHTTNGADYQYVMTLIPTQKDKANPEIASFMEEQLNPYLYDEMNKTPYLMAPYVNVFGTTPDEGFAGFLETPRYATGYSNLFNAISYTTEAHMFKSYADRVMATYSFLKFLGKYVRENGSEIRKVVQRANALDAEREVFPLRWELDTSASREIEFQGYEYDYLPSELHAGKRLKYDRNRPVTWNVDYYNTYAVVDSVTVPDFYLLPAAFGEVAERLQMNGVEMFPLSQDLTVNCEVYYIEDYSSPDRPYEGHYFHRRVETRTERMEMTYHRGDYLIPTSQVNRRFIVETLEPRGMDSYFTWNFFDGILQQKEWFSTYVFEDTALDLLKSDPELARKFEEWKQANPEGAKDGFQSLYFIYRNSPYYEKSHMRYPVGRVVDEVVFPIK